MSTKTKIQWADKTWNPTIGCDRISPGCANCYAKTLHDMRHAAYARGKRLPVQYAVPFETIQLKPERLSDPLRWRKPSRIFVNSVSDLFHESIPDAYIDQMFAAMAMAPWHQFQVLTKRPHRMHRYLTERTFGNSLISEPSAYKRVVAAMDMPVWMPGGKRFLRVPKAWPLPNVWLGVSVENQRWADERIPLLLDTPADVRFVSYEPALEAVDFTRWVSGCRSKAGNTGCVRCQNGNRLPSADWVIVGGESGTGARPFHIAWARHVIDQCKEAGVAVFVKQLGAVPVIDEALMSGPLAIEEQHLIYRQWPSHVTFGNKTNDSRLNGRCVFLRDGHGGEINEWPVDLRVRDYPHVVTT